MSERPLRSHRSKTDARSAIGKSGHARQRRFTSGIGCIHDRMPVILEHENVAPWLSGQSGTELLIPAAEEKLTS